jgi:flagellum-specific peptidoglycan hydrolase FlgJ
MNEKLPLIAAAAFVAQEKTGCPGLLLIAQCALETGWLKSAPENNCFGIKEYPGCYDRQLLHTIEWFTDAEREWFLRINGRTAELINPVQTAAHERHKYSVQDWFAAFQTLGDCFAKRAEMWDRGPYAPAAEAFKVDSDLPKFVRSIAPIYATDPGYADQVLAIIRQSNVQAAWAEAQRQQGALLT